MLWLPFAVPKPHVAALSRLFAALPIEPLLQFAPVLFETIVFRRLIVPLSRRIPPPVAPLLWLTVTFVSVVAPAVVRIPPP